MYAKNQRYQVITFKKWTSFPAVPGVTKGRIYIHKTGLYGTSGREQIQTGNKTGTSRKAVLTQHTLSQIT